MKEKFRAKWRAPLALLLGLALALSFSLVTGVPVAASPNDWYVDASVSESGDGTSWETAFKTIQEGVNAATAGDTINVAAGTYKENVVLDKQLTLIGDPSTPSNVVVDAQGSGYPIKITADGCTLKGFKVVNCGTNTAGIMLHQANNNIVENNIASDNTVGWGIRLYAGWPVTACSSNTIKNNIANGNGQAGIALGQGANSNIVEQNQANNNTYGGIDLTRCSGNTLKNNTATGNGAIGIIISGTEGDPCTNNSVIGNTVSNNGGIANIYLSYCHNHIVEGNTANSNTGSGDGIRVRGNNNTIRNNTANSNPEGGMQLAGDNYTIENNTCNSNAYRGIWLGGSDASVVSNSIVKNNTLDGNNVGILLWTCHSSNVTSNTITNNTNYGIQVASNSPDNLINCNNIVGNGTYGVSNEGTTQVDATNNWWGDVAGPSDKGPDPYVNPYNEITSGQDIYGPIDYIPWMIQSELDAGWNIWSAPIAPDQDSWEQMKDELVTDWAVEAVYYFDSATQLWGADPDDAGLLDAYYIKVPDDARIRYYFSDDATFPAQKVMEVGWNFIGLTELHDMDVKDALSDCYYGTGVATGLVGYSKVISPSLNGVLWTHLRDGESPPPIFPTKGYWVFMVNDGVLGGFTSTPIVEVAP